MVDRAHAWQTAGQSFTWYPQGRSGDALQIFYRCLGHPTSPAIVLLHGFPTSSYDFHLLASDLSTDHYVCLFDFPGYGFSDKPLKGYTYTLRDDARLVDFFVQQIVSLQRFALLTHDRGDSVGLALLAGFPAYRQLCFGMPIYKMSMEEVRWEAVFPGIAASSSPFSAHSHPSVQNRSTLQLIYHR